MARKLRSKTLFIILALTLIGLVDSAYLTRNHYSVSETVKCGFGIFSNCGKVLNSKYSEIFGIPLAVFGLIHYFLLTVSTIYLFINNKRITRYAIIVLSTFGLFASAYFMFLQLAVIRSICPYCTLSALVSLTLFYIIQKHFAQDRKRLTTKTTYYFYTRIVRHILFLTKADWIHESILKLGNSLGNSTLVKNTFSYLFMFEDKGLKQKLAGITFPNPVGIAAGFDYEACLTQLTPSLGFGYETIGTITNQPYKGNTTPRLGRLVKSKSLMVNKGFKNEGAEKIIDSIKGYKFLNPLGVSIGRTNSIKITTQEKSISDIILAFNKFKVSKIMFDYYELNISCPNLRGNISFYPPKNLENLLTKIDGLKIKKPIFVKMPISLSDHDTLLILKVISKHSPKGIIIGNLQTKRKIKPLLPSEVNQFPIGNFSGKPTLNRSNKLIKLAYTNYKDRFIIIGCGGIFTGDDAYTKIKLGASMVQLITGLIFQGPQLATQINIELIDLYKKDGFTHISQAVGKDT